MSNVAPEDIRNALYADLARNRRNIGVSGDQGDLVNQYADQSGPVAPIGNALSPLITNASMGIPQGGIQSRFQGSPVDVFGQGKGYMQPDGTIIGVNQAGQQFKVQPEGTQDMLQARRDKEMLRQAQMQKMREGELDIQTKQAALQSGGKPQFNADMGGYVYAPTPENPNGRFVPIAGLQQKGIKSTEDEKKAAGYVVRMQTALQQMEDVSKENPDSAKPNPLVEMIGGVSSTAKNYLQSEPRQRIEAAQEDALDAALTLATGAAYTKEQLAGLKKSYFPQAGDTTQTIKDKRARFDDVIKTARLRAGAMEPGADKVISQSGQSGAPQGIPKTGEVVDGHIFLGGNPADPARWRKQ